MRVPTVEIEVNGRKKIVNADDPRAQGARAEIPTRESIANMKKADVVSWLEAHGVEKPVGKLPELRDMLVRVMFVEG